MSDYKGDNMDWKNKLERTIGINTAIVKAEQTNHLYSKMIADLEEKNRVLHQCAYFAHGAIEKVLASFEDLSKAVSLDTIGKDLSSLFAQTASIKIEMERILSQEPVKVIEKKMEILLHE